MNPLYESTYQIYGVTLSSSQPLPILTPVSTPTVADVKVHLTQAEVLLSSDEAENRPRGWHKQQKADGVYHCLFLGGEKASFHVEIAPNGKQIWIAWSNIPLAEVTAILIGCVIGTALRLQGKICLHSSVINIDNRAIAIIGAKGAGKSTTAAALAKQGYPVLADDIAVLAKDGKTFLVQPGYPRLRLWKPAVNALYGSEKGLSRVFQQTDKHFVELNQHQDSAWHFHSQPLPLAAVYVLGTRSSSPVAPSLEAMTPQAGLMHLFTHRYPQTLKLESDEQAREFAILGDLAMAIPMRSLNREDNLTKLSEICHLISADIAQLETERIVGKPRKPLVSSESPFRQHPAQAFT